MTSEDYDRIVLVRIEEFIAPAVAKAHVEQNNELADAYERALKKLSANDQPSNEKKGDCQNPLGFLHGSFWWVPRSFSEARAKFNEESQTFWRLVVVASCAALALSTALVLGAFMAFRCYGHDSSECIKFAGSLYTDTYFRDFKEARLTMPELIYFDWQDLKNWRVALGTIPNSMDVPPVELIDSSRFFSMLNLIAACVKPIFSIGAALIEIVGWVNKSKAVGELAEATASVCAVLDAHAQEDEDHRHMINGLRGMGLDVSDCKVNEEKS